MSVPPLIGWVLTVVQRNLPWFTLAFAGFVSVTVGAEVRYVYDDAGQLVRAVYDNGSVVSYSYDAAGNLFEVSETTQVGLAVFGFVPGRGTIGSTITVQGQGFDPTSEASVEIGGALGEVIAGRGPDTLVVEVPSGADTGPICVTIAAVEACSMEDFIVIGAPTVAGLAPSFGIAGRVGTHVVTGTGLLDAQFKLEPVGPTVILAGFGVDGASVSLTISPDTESVGDHVVVAVSRAGSSKTSQSEENTLHVLDPVLDEDADLLDNLEEAEIGTDPFDGDSDGDGFGDGDEVAFGSDPTDPGSLPVDPLELPREAEGRVWSVLNVIDPSLPPPGEPQDPGLFVGEAEGRPFSVLNTIDPSLPSEGEPMDPLLFVGEAEGQPFSVLNTSDPSLPSEGEPVDSSLFVGETEGALFSVLNTIDPSLPVEGEPMNPLLLVGETEGPLFSVLNSIDPGLPAPGETPDLGLFEGESSSHLFSVENLAE